MLSNLKCRMWQKHITGRQISELLDVRPETVSDKILEKTNFTRTEMFRIYDTYFKGEDMAELFASDENK